MDRPWELAEDQLSSRRVERAGVLLQANWQGSPSQTVFVRDADNGSFSKVPCERAGSTIEAVALSRDGGHLAYFTQSFTRADRCLYVHTLADGTEVRFDPPSDGEDVHTAFSPDGHTLAVLSATDARGPDDQLVDERLTVSIIDLATGDRRHVWSGPGLAPSERAVGWSPNGSFLAVTHADMDEQPAVTVLDAASARLVNQFTDREILSCPQGAWISDQELVVFPDDVDDESPLRPTFVVDVVTGAVRVPGEIGNLPYGCWGLANGRMIGSFAPHTIGTVAPDGSNPRTLLSYPPTAELRVVDIAPDAGPLL